MPNSERLPQNFETFDFFNPCTTNVTSAKTLNTLTLSRLTNPARLYQHLVEYIDQAAEFSEPRRGESALTASEINFRIMQVAIPSGTTAEQMQQLGAAVQYGRSRGVIVIIRKAK
jgi:filamentous hemagglutinin